MASLISVAASGDPEDEKGVWEHLSYTWVIENMDSYSEDVVNTLRSPTFFNKVRDCEFQMELGFPPKNVRSNESYLSVYLSTVLVPNDEVQVEFTLSLRDSEDNDIITDTCNAVFNEQCNTWGFENMVRLSELQSKMRDKILKIHADALIKVFRLEKKGKDLVTVSRFSDARLQKNMNELFESSSFTDVVFEVKGAELKAHKCILSARSPVFAAMFTHDGIEKNSGVVKIVDFDCDIFRSFLHFVYSGRVSIPSVDVAINLYRAAEKYGSLDLNLLCIRYMCANLNPSNVGSVLLLAETFLNDDLKQVVMDYMVANIKNLCDVEMEVYKLLEKENPKLLTEFLVMLSKNLLKKISP